MNCDQENKNVIDLIHFIDFLKTAHIWPKQDFTPIGVTVANKNKSKIQKGIGCCVSLLSFIELYQCPKLFVEKK